MDDWDTDENGNFKMHAFHGYESAIAPGNVLLRMLYFTENSDLPPNVPHGLQFAMTPDMARKLARDLIANADQA
ncbi:MAG: hypothetical protein AAGE05_15195 [Pseudomonadota bacterium]